MAKTTFYALMQFWFKCDLHEADAFTWHLPTAKAVGYAPTAPTGLASFASALTFHYLP